MPHRGRSPRRAETTVPKDSNYTVAGGGPPPRLEGLMARCSPATAPRRDRRPVERDIQRHPPAPGRVVVVGPGAARAVELLAVLDPAGCSPAVGGRGSSRVWLEVRAPGGARQGREEVSLGLLFRGRYQGWLEGAVGWKKSVRKIAYSQVNTLVNTSWYYPVLLAALIGLFYSDLNRPRRRITTGSTDFLPSLPRAARRALSGPQPLP